MIIHRITRAEDGPGWWLWETEATPRYRVLKGDPYKEGQWVRIAWAIHHDLIVDMIHLLMRSMQPMEQAS